MSLCSLAATSLALAVSAIARTTDMWVVEVFVGRVCVGRRLRLSSSICDRSVPVLGAPLFQIPAAAWRSRCLVQYLHSPCRAWARDGHNCGGWAALHVPARQPPIAALRLTGKCAYCAAAPTPPHRAVTILPMVLEMARLFGGFFLSPANLPKYFSWCAQRDTVSASCHTVQFRVHAAGSLMCAGQCAAPVCTLVHSSAGTASCALMCRLIAYLYHAPALAATCWLALRLASHTRTAGWTCHP